MSDWLEIRVRLDKYVIRLYRIGESLQEIRIVWSTSRLNLNSLKTSKRNKHEQNLRPTTRECVHLVTRGHFASRDNDGCHTNRSAVSKNPIWAERELHGPICHRTGVIARRLFYVAGIGNFWLFRVCNLNLDQMTLYTNLTHIP